MNPMPPIAGAFRLFDRAVDDYRCAFDVAAGDGPYIRSDYFNDVKSRGKDALAILKDEQRDLLQDARSLREQTEPIVTHTPRSQRQCWDFEGFKTWPQCRYPVRVVRSLEPRQSRRQLDGKLDEVVSDWVWATTVFRNRVSTSEVVHMGHSRWNIETGDSRSLQPQARRPRLQTSRQRHFGLLAVDEGGPQPLYRVLPPKPQTCGAHGLRHPPDRPDDGQRPI